MRDELFIVTQNFKLVYKIQQALGHEYYINHQLNLNGNLKTAKFIISSTRERSSLPHHNVLAINPNFSVLKIKNMILSKIFGMHSQPLTIGIDPGHTIGIAMLQDTAVIITNAFYSTEHLVRWIKIQLRELVYSMLTIKIGNGDPQIRDGIIKRLQQDGFHNILMVNEEHTSVKLMNSMTRHETAAILIAKRDGTGI